MLNHLVADAFSRFSSSRILLGFCHLLFDREATDIVALVSSNETFDINTKEKDCFSFGARILLKVFLVVPSFGAFVKILRM